MKSVFKALIIIVFGMASLRAVAQTNTLKVATQARFDLNGDAASGALTNGYATQGDASVDRQTWLSAAEQPRSFTINYTVSHFGWMPATFRFTPASNGVVTLTIRGPWEMGTNGLIWKQEVLWDSLSATGASLPNGSFESVSSGVPAGWYRTYGVDATTDTGPVTPVSGNRYARVWHDGPLSVSLTVTGGVPVILKFFARASFPAGFPDMQRISSTNTPAHVAAVKFMRGVNLGNYLEAPPGEDWGAHYSAVDFTQIRSEGFDHVRIPVGWNFRTGPAPGYVISNNFFGAVDFMITNALNRGLRVILNIHNYNEFSTNPYGETNRFYSIWTQVAAYYSNSPPELAFELINEPNGNATTAILNPIYAEAIRRIRLSNPGRTIFVGPSQWQSINELNNLQLPANDSNIVTSVHCYDPFLYTHQGATWAGPDPSTTGLIFPGPPASPLTPAPGISSWASNWIAQYNQLPAEGNPCSSLAFASKLDFARQWSDYYGRPVHVGEFGAFSTSEPNSRARFYSAFRSKCEEVGLGWAMWDWKAGFYYWNDATSQPATGLRNAMFPAVQLLSLGPGRFSFSSAIGKTYRIDIAGSLVPPVTWGPIATQTLTAPSWTFTDPAAIGSNRFYRAVWVK